MSEMIPIFFSTSLWRLAQDIIFWASYPKWVCGHNTAIDQMAGPAYLPLIEHIAHLAAFGRTVKCIKTLLQMHSFWACSWRCTSHNIKLNIPLTKCKWWLCSLTLLGGIRCGNQFTSKYQDVIMDCHQFPFVKKYKKHSKDVAQSKNPDTSIVLFCTILLAISCKARRSHKAKLIMAAG